VHQPSAPTPEYGAPVLPIIDPNPPRGRCAICVQPIRQGQPSTQVTPAIGITATSAIPYRHKSCAERPSCSHQLADAPCRWCP
jgi:hypothetical protein